MAGVCLAPAIRAEGPVIWIFPIFGPKRPIKHSPEFTLGNFLIQISPERAVRYGENRLQAAELDRLHISSPFRAKRVFWLTQGKPWAKLSCPFGAGRIIGAKHILCQLQ
jgi:hypothetical protein